MRWSGFVFAILAAFLLFLTSTVQAQILFRSASQASVVTQVGLTPALIDQESANNNAGSRTQVEIDVPGDVEAGHVLIAHVTRSGIATINAPGGWTLLNSTSTSTPGGEITQAVYWRVATDGEPGSYTWSWSGNARAAGAIAAFANIDTISPIDTWGVQATNSNTTITLPILTASSGNTMLVAALGSSITGNDHNNPTGMTRRYNRNAAGGTDGVTLTGHTQLVAAGSTGSKTASSDFPVDNIAHLIALRPVGALRINVPLGTVDGDVMIASILYRPCSNTSGGNCTASIYAPAAWTLVNTIETKTGGGVDGYGSRLLIYQRVANSEPVDYTWTFGGTPVQAGAAGGILSFSGVDTSNPIVAQAGQVTPISGDNNRQHRTPSIDTGAVGNTMLVTTHAVNSSGSFTGQASLTEQVDIASRTPPNDLGVTLGIFTEEFPLAGITGTRLATQSNPPNGDTGAAHILALRPLGPHHLEIEHGSGTGLTCTPNTITVRACANAACTVGYTGGVSGMLGATGTTTVNWDGGTGGAAGSGFSIPVNSSTVTKNFQVTTVGTTILSIASSSPNAMNSPSCNFGSPSCTFTSADAGFFVSVPHHRAETATTLTIQAVRKSDNSLACVPGITGSKSINFKCSYVNPSTGSLPMRMDSTPLAADATSACSNTGANLNLSFDASGVASATLHYADVGEMKIDATFTGAAGSLEEGLILTGGTSFIAAPASFGFSNITSGPIKAGASFGAILTAQNAAGNATPNFGKESPAAYGAVLSSDLVSPSGGTNPALGNNAVSGSAFVNGMATLSNLSWPEVGTITITANLSPADYLGSGLASATGTSGNIGRFIPNHFDTAVSGGMTCPTGLTCPATFNGFVYSGQAFATQITARNLGGGTTQNYDSAMAHSNAVTLTAWDARGGAVQNPNGGTLGANAVAASAFTLGVVMAATPSYALLNVYPHVSPTAPTDIYIRVTESAGGDGVSSNRGAASVEGGIKIVAGRIFIPNAYGSELLKLPLNATVQYWNGSRYVTSTTDSATVIPVNGIGFTNCKNNLSTGDAPPNNCKTVLEISTPPSSLNVANGLASFSLNAPGSGNTGSTDVLITSPAYLPGMPGRATFGIYKSRFIYLRELY